MVKQETFPIDIIEKVAANQALRRYAENPQEFLKTASDQDKEAVLWAILQEIQKELQSS